MNDRDDPRGQGEPEPPEEASPARRRFLARVTMGAGACGALLGVPLVGFVVAPLWRSSPRVWRAVGPVSSFKVGDTVNVPLVDSSPLPWAGVTAREAVWLRRTGDSEFVAFAVNCSHLGCPVRWLPSANLFMCPCHGGVYYADGSRAAGPPPHGLWKFPVRIRDDQVEVRADPTPIA